MHFSARFFVLLFAASASAWSADQGVDPGAVPRFSSANEPPAPTTYPRADVLVSTEQLSKWIDARDPKLVLIDARDSDPFFAAHIPLARNLSSDGFQSSDPPYFMPTAEALTKTFVELGIHADSRVVIYDNDDGRLAARVWFTLHAFGHENVAILNGGIGRWKDERRVVVGDPSLKPTPGTFVPSATPRGTCVFTDLPQFHERAQTFGRLPATTLLDARSLKEYTGEESRGKNPGHIPGAANMEWSAVLVGKEKSRLWRAAPELHALLRMAGLERDKKTAVYDQAGGRSAHLYFTLWLMGFEQPVNYVAGWREYGNREDVEVER